jgi:uncharacterized membrane protein
MEKARARRRAFFLVSFVASLDAVAMNGVRSEPLLLDETLRPSPPLSARTLAMIVAVVAAINLGFILYFVSKGAWPVAPFMGLDVALLAWAFRESRIAARAHERITLRASELRIEQHPAKGTVTEAAFNPYWVRVDLVPWTEYSNRLYLRSHGRSLQVGAFLPPQTREGFAQTLKTALSRAKMPDFGPQETGRNRRSGTPLSCP